MDSVEKRQQLGAYRRPHSTHIRATIMRNNLNNLSSKKVINKLVTNSKTLLKKRRSRKIKKNNKNSIQKNYSDNSLLLPFKIYWPLKKHSFWISSPFGERHNPNKRIQEMHWGADLAAPKGSPVYPVQDGEVIMAESKKGYGKCIIIDHGENIKTRYAHLCKINVQVGAKVDKETCIGLVGATGNARGTNGYHLHLELYINNRRYDPLPYLSW